MKNSHIKCKEELQIAIIKVSFTNIWGLCAVTKFPGKLLVYLWKKICPAFMIGWV